MDRRNFIEGLTASFCGSGSGLLAQLPGPPMLSAAVIARRGNGAIALRAVDGIALRPPGSPLQDRAFGYDDPFRVASVSKMIAATGFMKLVSAGAIDLDADVSEYLGEELRHPAFPGIAITSRMLLSHCSGIRNGADYPVPFGASLLGRLTRAAQEADYGGWFSPATERPGFFFAYSDTNFALLAQIMERVSGVRFDRFMRDSIFAPIDLDVGYNWSGVSQPKRNRAAAGARWIDGALTPQIDSSPPRAPEVALFRPEYDARAQESDYRLGANGFSFAPQGGLRLSVKDMDRLVRVYAQGGVHGGKRICDTETLSLMTAAAWRFDPALANGSTENGFHQSYGLGVHCPMGRNGVGAGDRFFGDETRDWRGHFGDAYGWMAGLFWNVRDRRTLVYAINGMPEFDRARAQRSALTAPEEAIVDMALAAFR